MVPISEQRKAILATLIAFLGGLAAALADNGVTTQEWVTIGLATVIAYGGVYGISNAGE